MRTFVIFNQKGGVGKTATVSNLATAFAKSEKKVLIVDADPQAHLSLGTLNDDKDGLANLLDRPYQLNSLILEAEPGVDMLPAGHDLLARVNATGCTTFWRHLLDYADTRYDLLLVDCPPAINQLVKALLHNSPELIVPVASDYLALRGLSDIVRLVRQLESETGNAPAFHIALTRFDQRRKLSKEIREKIRSYFPDNLLEPPIRECVAIAEAPSFGCSVINHKPSSNGARDYRSMAQSLLSTDEGGHHGKESGRTR